MIPNVQTNKEDKEEDKEVQLDASQERGGKGKVCIEQPL